MTTTTTTASEIKTGMKYWDGSTITIKRVTGSFIIVDLADGFMMEGKSVEVKWKKSSKIKTITE
jgi:myo-inositol-hexaphosphate 3-phosphohydrolase